MAVTDAVLLVACKEWSDFPRLEGIYDEEYEYRLGLLCVHKTNDRYRFGYSFTTSATSRFIKRRMDFPDHGVDAWGVVFRQFDRFDGPNDPPEFAIGWVPFAQEEELDGWIEFLNEELMKQRQRRLQAAGDLPAPGDLPATGAGAGSN